MSTRHEFGAELRRRRTAAGLSLTDLERLLHYSRGHLSKIETGKKPVSELLARQADMVLDAGGALAGLVVDDRPAVMSPPAGNGSSLVNPNRRDVLAFGSALLVPLAITRGNAEALTEDTATEQYYRDQFDHIRKRGQQSVPALVLRSMSMELCTLVELADAARNPVAQARLRILAARYGEYAGWMAQEAGDTDSARQWTVWAATSAAAAGDPTLAAYASVREAELAMYENKGYETVHLAQVVQQLPHADARVRGLAAHREAQGHALLGAHRECRAALDRAEELLHESSPGGPGGPTLGSTTVLDLGLAVTGWCMYDLGRPKEAAESLERTLAQTAPTGLRARALYGTRLALAYEATGDLDRMCEVATRVIQEARSLGSSTVHDGLRNLARKVARRHHYHAARQLQVEINATLAGMS